VVAHDLRGIKQRVGAAWRSIAWNARRMSFLRYLPVTQLIVVLVAAILAALLAAAPPLVAHDRGRAVTSAARVLLLGSVVAIFVLTLLPTSQSGFGLNLVPLRGIAGQLRNINGPLGAINIAGNAAMFAPAGLLAAFSLGWGVRRVSAVALVLSVTIELLQLASGRSADVDDLILNTAGAAVGALLCLLAARFRQQRRAHRAVLGEPPRTATAT